MKYTENSNTIATLQDISSPEDTWAVSYESYKGIYPNIRFFRIDVRTDMKLRWITEGISEVDRFDFIRELKSIDFDTKTIFIKSYCMPSEGEIF